MKNRVLFGEWFEREVVFHPALSRLLPLIKEPAETWSDWGDLAGILREVDCRIQRGVAIIGEAREDQYVAERSAETGEELYLFTNAPRTLYSEPTAAPFLNLSLSPLLETSDALVEELKTTDDAWSVWTRLHLVWLEMRARTRAGLRFAEKKREALFKE